MVVASNISVNIFKIKNAVNKIPPLGFRSMLSL